MPRKRKTSKSAAAHDEFDKLLKRIVKIELAVVQEAMGSTPWTYAFHHEQGAEDSGVRLAKLRVQVPDEVKLRDFPPNLKYSSFMFQVWDLKDKLFSKPYWYGLKLTFYPDGKFQTEYLYDKDCPPGFYDP
jgi:hypothetical protein